MSLTMLHNRLGNAAILFFLIISLWGFWRFFRKQGIDPSYWGALAVGEVFLLAQSGIGAYLWVIGARPARGIHILYGIVALMAIPMAYTYTRGRDNRPEGLIYSTTTLFTVGLILRAIMTALDS